MQSITINGVTQQMHIKQTNTLTDFGDGKSTDYILIQLDKPLTKAGRAELVEAQVESFERIDEHLYLCHYKPTDLTPLQSKPFVQGVQIYRREFKIDDSLQRLISEAGRPDLQPVDLAIELHPVKAEGVSPESVADKLAEELNASPSQIEVHPETDTIDIKTAEAEQLNALKNVAVIDAVKTVTNVVPKTLYNDRARDILGLGPQSLPRQPIDVPATADGQTGKLTFQGEGQVIAIADTGLDTGIDDDSMHPAFKNRIRKLVSIGRGRTNGKCDDRHGHGTHVCGSAVGGLVPDHKPIQGAAPAAQLVMQSLFKDSLTVLDVPTDNNLVKMFTDPYDQYEARIHSNSWGDSGRADEPQKLYSNEAKLVDDLVFQRPDLLILFSAGNDGDINSNPTIAGIAAAKNILTVGASESTRPSVHGIPVETKLCDNDPTEISWFSARGPTRESRVKPEVLAPGTAILSARTQNVPRPAPADFTLDPDDKLFCYAWGTSMATPLVAGCAAVLREYLAKVFKINPSAALMKALLINGAYMFHHAHSSKEGFGLVSVANSILPQNSPEGGFFDSGPVMDVDATQDAARTVTVTIPRSTFTMKASGPKPPPGDTQVLSAPFGMFKTSRVSPPARAGVTLKATVAFTDQSGEQLQSTIILFAKSSDGTIRYGNKGSSRYFDRYNNVQQVVWKGITPRDATVSVWARELSFPNQGYSLVWRVIPNED